MTMPKSQILYNMEVIPQLKGNAQDAKQTETTSKF